MATSELAVTTHQFCPMKRTQRWKIRPHRFAAAKALDRFWADIITAGLSHPFPVWHVSEVLKWVESGEYAALMDAPESAAA